MKFEKGKAVYALPDDFDRFCDCFLHEDALLFARCSVRNPHLTGSPVVCEVVKGFDTEPEKRLFVWPTPDADYEVAISYWPVLVAKVMP